MASTDVISGALRRLLLAVHGIDAARADLVRCGVEVSRPFHLAGGPVPAAPHSPARQPVRSARRGLRKELCHVFEE